jgi:hypothetical protein
MFTPLGGPSVPAQTWGLQQTGPSLLGPIYGTGTTVATAYGAIFVPLGADSSAKLARLSKRSARLDKRSWGLFLSRRKASIQTKAKALMSQAQNMDWTSALSIAAGTEAMQEGVVPPVDTSATETAAVVATPAVSPWIWVAGGLAVAGVIVVMTIQRKRS